MAKKTNTLVNSKPEFKIGEVYKTTDSTAVRKGPGFHNSVKLNAILMTDGKRHKLNTNGELDAGTPILCKETAEVAGNIWVKCPSGWVIGYCDGRTLLTP